jgi:hypothetical protein
MSFLRWLVGLGAIAAHVACSSGVGSKFGSTTNPPHEASEEGSEPPGRDQTDDPPGTREGAACLPCTSAYKCSGLLDDKAQESQIFTFRRNDCPTSGSSQGKDDNTLTFACGGTVAIPGRTVVGTWKDVGAGVLEICFGVLGRDQCLTCSPTSIQNVAVPGTGSTRDAGRRD